MFAIGFEVIWEMGVVEEVVTADVGPTNHVKARQQSQIDKV